MFYPIQLSQETLIDSLEYFGKEKHQYILVNLSYVLFIVLDYIYLKKLYLQNTNTLVYQSILLGIIYHVFILVSVSQEIYGLYLLSYFLMHLTNSIQKNMLLKFVSSMDQKIVQAIFIGDKLSGVLVLLNSNFF
jgi:hypothetical protein